MIDGTNLTRGHAHARAQETRPEVDGVEDERWGRLKGDNSGGGSQVDGRTRLVGCCHP